MKGAGVASGTCSSYKLQNPANNSHPNEQHTSSGMEELKSGASRLERKEQTFKSDRKNHKVLLVMRAQEEIFRVGHSWKQLVCKACIFSMTLTVYP